jgi:hypothetical protein
LKINSKNSKENIHETIWKEKNLYNREKEGIDLFWILGEERRNRLILDPRRN